METLHFNALAAAALMVVLVASLVSRWRYRAKYDLHLIPGPRAYPLLGNLPQMISWKRPQLHLKVLEWMKEYGKIVKVQLPGVGSQHHLYISDPEYIQNNISGHGAHGLPKSALYEEFKRLGSPTGEENLFTSLETTEYWKAMRKGMAKAFSTSALKGVFPKLSRKAFELVEVIRKRPSTEPIEIQELLVRLMFDAIGVGGYDIDFKSLQNEHHPFLEALDFCADDSLASILNPFRRLLKGTFPSSKLAKDCNKMYSQLHSYYGWISRELRGRKEPDANDMSVWACLMRIIDPRTGAPLDDMSLPAAVATFILGGTDTSSHQIMWALFAIATHHGVQQNIVEELKSSGVFHQIREEGADHLSYSDLMGLEYLGMVVKEAMRLFPVGPLGSMRITPKDMRIYGYRVPKGTMVHINVLGLSNAPWLWDKPEVFNPERWRRIESQGELVADAQPGQKSGPRRIWAFGDGPRDCVGQRLAIVQLHLVLAVLLANFQVRLAARMGGWEGVLSHQYLSLVMSIDGGLWLHCEARPSFGK